MPRKKDRYIYDIESYGNVFTAIFKNEITAERKRFVIFGDPDDDRYSINDAANMVDFMEREVHWLIGYNNSEYDDLLMKYAMNESDRLRTTHPRKVAGELNELTRKLFAAQYMHKKAPEYYMLNRLSVQWRSLDLMQLFNPKDRRGLKRVAITLRWPMIEDLPFKAGSVITREQLPHLLTYNDNDVDMTEAIKNEMAEAINHRIAYTVKYGTDIINSSNSAIGRQIMADVYSRHMGITVKDFEHRTTEYATLALRSCISPKVHFFGKECLKAYAAVEKAVIDPNIEDDDEDEDGEVAYDDRTGKKKKKKPQFELRVRSKYLMHCMKLGGLHSEGPPEILDETDEYAYIDLDVSGYYPRIICNDGLYPAHLSPMFTTLFETYIVNERTRIKAQDAILAYLLKIAANAAFGQTNSRGKTTSWLKDPRMANYITINGQLYLFMLLEGLESHSNCIVVYSNTDGLTVKVPRSEMHIFEKICDRWQQYTGFELEFKSYRKMIMRNVNNYLIFVNTDNPKERIKAKGIYQYESLLAKELKIKGVVYPIIAMAAREWFDKGVPVEETIYGSTTIYDFIKAENTSPVKFDVILYHSDSKLPDKMMQKNNRWIVTKGNPLEGRMVKISRKTGEKTEMQKGFRITEVNNVDEARPLKDYCLHYEFYIDQANSLINITRQLGKETHIPPFVQGSLALE